MSRHSIDALARDPSALRRASGACLLCALALELVGPPNPSVYGATAAAFATVAIVLHIVRRTVFARDSLDECGGCR